MKVLSRSVVSNSLWPHGLEPARFLCSWDFPGKNTGLGSHSLLQGIFLTQGLNPGLLPYRQILCHLNHQEKLNVLSKQKMKLRLKDPTASLFETCREHNIIIISVERYLELVTLTYAVQKWQADLNGGPEIKSLKIPEKSLETEQCCHQRGAEGVVNRRVYCLEIIIVCSYKFGRFLVQLYNYTYIWRIEMNYVLCM